GYTPIIHGNSYMQVISWDEAGNLDPRAMLTYSQSPEPESPHYSDLTEIHAQGVWIRLPFTDAEIEADPNLRILNLTE
ncbi:MAG: penicillin acylase family protein, partial [Gammaproteobacteria bacterium]|nr:penicillin acylase family protein [Gammaproteobacteria bacterium]